MLSLEAPDPKDRVLMSSIRFFFTMAVVLFINYNVNGLVEKVGWTGMSVIFGILATVLLLITFAGTKERTNLEKNTAKASEEEKISVWESFRLLFKNKYFLLVTVIFVVDYTILGVNNGLVIMAVTETSFATAAAGLVCLEIGGIPHNAGLFAMVADVIDYGEWKTGVRLDGLTNSVTSFGMKVGAGFGSAIVGWGLAWAAYDGQLEAQAAATVAGIKDVFIFVPIVLIIVGAIALFFCNLDKIYPQIAKGLEERRNQNS